MKVHVLAPTRLHFGLLATQPPFGGLGAMLDSPRVVVTVTLGDTQTVNGTLAERAISFVERIAPLMLRKQEFIVHADGPREHTGFGIGTALGMAIARGMTEISGLPLELDDLADLAKRGQRSRIGVYGSAHGGFLFDQGHGRKVRRVGFPKEWRFAILTATSPGPWQGDRERAAFSRPREATTARDTMQRLRGLLEDRLLPAVAIRDFPLFAAALGDYNRVAGEPFAADQGGPYADRSIGDLILQLRSEGFPGAGQSSWGPTVFVPVANDDDIARLRKITATIAMEMAVTKVAESGAELRIE